MDRDEELGMVVLRERHPVGQRDEAVVGARQIDIVGA